MLSEKFGVASMLDSEWEWGPRDAREIIGDPSRFRQAHAGDFPVWVSIMNAARLFHSCKRLYAHFSDVMIPIG